MEQKDKNYKYLQFPLCLIMETYKDIESGMNLIIDYGLIYYATKQKFDLRDVAKQTCYDYYRNQNDLPGSIINTINTYDEFIPDEDYNGFSGAEFNPEDNIEQILSLFEENSEFKDHCVLRYRIHTAAAFFNVKIHDYESTIRRYKKALSIKESFEAKFGPDVFPSCKPGMLFQVRDGNHKDIDFFRAYIGIKSMLGHRNFISSNKPAILSRMVGCKSKAAFEYYTEGRFKEKAITQTIERYSKRYHMDNLLLSLAERKYTMFLSKEKVSVIYLSTYMDPENLAKIIKEAKDRQNIKQRIRNVTASL
ncbi:MAG TPA: hypothetical protein VK213_05985 [Bacteroidales bacterium]|nr:hypothetical protein [Bacteroidales bacterium]